MSAPLLRLGPPSADGKPAKNPQSKVLGSPRGAFAPFLPCLSPREGGPCTWGEMGSPLSPSAPRWGWGAFFFPLSFGGLPFGQTPPFAAPPKKPFSKIKKGEMVGKGGWGSPICGQEVVGSRGKIKISCPPPSLPGPLAPELWRPAPVHPWGFSPLGGAPPPSPSPDRPASGLLPGGTPRAGPFGPCLVGEGPRAPVPPGAPFTRASPGPTQARRVFRRVRRAWGPGRAFSRSCPSFRRGSRPVDTPGAKRCSPSLQAAPQKSLKKIKKFSFFFKVKTFFLGKFST